MAGKDTKMERRESHIEIADKIARIEVALVKGFTESTAHHESTSRYITELKKDQERIMHSLYGNGQEGLVTKIAKISQRVNILWFVVVSVCGAYLTLGTGVLQQLLIGLIKH